MAILYTKKSSQRRKKSKARPLVFMLLAVFACTLYLLFFKWHNTNEAATYAGTNNQSQSIPKIIPKLHTDEVLQSQIDSWAAGQPSNFSINVRELNGDLRTASYQPERSMVTASTYKVFVAYAALHSIEQGKYTLNSKTRTGQSIETCLNKMIINSDNDCGRAIGFLLGWSSINDLVHQQGFVHTELNNYIEGNDSPVGEKYTTANDEADLLYGLYSGKLLNKSNADLLFSLMKQQVWGERIAAGLPVGIEAATKPGWLSGVQNDMGIVYGTNSTYIIVILSDGNNTAPLAQLSKLVYDYLNGS